MAYGISVNNSSGHKIIQDTSPIYALKRSGTLSYHQTTNVGTTPYTSVGLPHLYGYRVFGTNAAITGDEEIFIEVDTGHWVSYMPFQGYISDGFTTAYNTLYQCQFTSTMSGPINYYIFDKMTSIPGAGSSSGYGTQVFNSSGECMWDSGEITNRVSNGLITSSTSSITSAANAVSLRSFYLKTESGSGQFNGGHTNFKSWYAKRNSITSWTIQKDGIVDYGFYPYQGGWYNFSTATTFLTGDAHALLAYV